MCHQPFLLSVIIKLILISITFEHQNSENKTKSMVHSKIRNWCFRYKYWSIFTTSQFFFLLLFIKYIMMYTLCVDFSIHLGIIVNF